MDKVLELATSSLPAWLIVLVVVGWLAMGKELVARAFNRDERRVARKKADLEMARLELEQEKLKKEALESGIFLRTATQSVSGKKWITPTAKILICAATAIGILTVFVILPAFANGMSDPTFKAHAGTLATLLLIDAIISVICPLLLRSLISDGFLIGLTTIGIFAGLFFAVGSALVVADAYGLSFRPQ